MKPENLPKAVYDWISRNGRDLARIARGVERIADELQQIRKALQEGDEKKGERDG